MRLYLALTDQTSHMCSSQLIMAVGALNLRTVRLQLLDTSQLLPTRHYGIQELILRMTGDGGCSQFTLKRLSKWPTLTNASWFLLRVLFLREDQHDAPSMRLRRNFRRHRSSMFTVELFLRILNDQYGTRRNLLHWWSGVAIATPDYQTAMLCTSMLDSSLCSMSLARNGFLPFSRPSRVSASASTSE